MGICRRVLSIFEAMVCLCLFMGVAMAGESVGFSFKKMGVSRGRMEKVKGSLKRVEIPFIKNEGQVDGRVGFYAKTFFGTVFVTKKGEIVYQLPGLRGDEDETKGVTKAVVIKERLVGGKVAEVKGEGKTETKVNYFIGKDRSKWKTGITTYGLVSLGEVYKGVELKLKAHGNNVEKLFYVKPGADPEKIRIEIEGTRAVEVGKDGGLKIETRLGEVKFTRPLVYQKINGKRVRVDGSYRIVKTRPHLVYAFNCTSRDLI